MKMCEGRAQCSGDRRPSHRTPLLILTPTIFEHSFGEQAKAHVDITRCSRAHILTRSKVINDAIVPPHVR